MKNLKHKTILANAFILVLLFPLVIQCFGKPDDDGKEKDNEENEIEVTRVKVAHKINSGTTSGTIEDSDSTTKGYKYFYTLKNYIVYKVTRKDPKTGDIKDITGDSNEYSVEAEYNYQVDPSKFTKLVDEDKCEHKDVTNLGYAFVIKPLTLSDTPGNTEEMIENDGFIIRGMKMTQLTKDQASKFYEVHQERPFYDDLCTIMSSGPIVAIALKKDNAVESFRNLIGATNPAEAEEGTIRKKYGKSLDENAVHGSDSNENALKETEFFFSEEELYR